MTTTPHYRLLRRVAQGGYAEIFEAVAIDEQGGERRIAVKRLLPSLSADPQHILSFTDEARIGRLLQHPHIAAVVDFGSLDGAPVQILDLVDGVDLRGLRERLAPEPVPTLAALELTRAVADALSYAHQAKDAEGHALGIVHRDVAPDNVLVSWEGEVKLVDFGIAMAHQRLASTGIGVIKGKVGFMAPEQFEARDVDPRADVFSLGCLLHELLTGQSALRDQSDLHPGRLRVEQSLAPGVVELISRATQLDRARRFATATEMLEALDAAIAAERQAPGSEELSALLGRIARPPAETWVDEGPRTLVSEMDNPGSITAGLSVDPALATTASLPTPQPGSAGEVSQVDGFPPVLGGVRLLRVVDRFADLVVLEGQHTVLGSPRVIILVRSHRWTLAAFSVLAAALAAISHPALHAVLDAGVDAEGQPFVVCDGPLGVGLSEIKPPSPASAARWSKESARVAQLLHQAGLPKEQILLRHVYLQKRGGQESLRVLPVHVFVDPAWHSELPRLGPWLERRLGLARPSRSLWFLALAGLAALLYFILRLALTHP